MPTLLIGYDLKKPGQEYPDLYERLQALGLWWHHLDSTWLLRTELSAIQVRDRLRQVLDANDKLLVIDVSGRQAAWAGVNERGSAWIKEWL